MPIQIPELQHYFGGKGGSGTYQNIINLIPPHNTFIVPFLGHCGILRNIRPAAHTIASDIDPFVVSSWQTYYGQNRNGRFQDQDRIDPVVFKNLDFRYLLLSHELDRPGLVIYCDPPYPLDTLSGSSQYCFKMSDTDHNDLLDILKSFRHAKVLISTYDNSIYRKELGHSNWHKYAFKSTTQQGMATETVYYNFPFPDRLHDYRYFGKNFKNREHYKLKRERLKARFAKMSPVEQHFYLEALQDITPLKI
ncbi:MAG: hypothetical protein AAF634_05620 [Bacteroidota bacterium]